MSSQKQIVLITGANSGSSKHVIITSRSTERGEAALKELKALDQPGSAEFLPLDVTSTSSIEAASKSVEASRGRLEALVNNAAVGTSQDGKPVAEDMRLIFETNCIGLHLVTDAFEPLLKKSTFTPRIINVSSGGGSIGMRPDPEMHARIRPLPSALAYRTSKAAMNMISAFQAMDYGDLGWKVFTYAPGFTVSNLGPLNNTESGAKPSVDAARPMVKMINGESDEKHGRFSESQGGEHPW